MKNILLSVAVLLTLVACAPAQATPEATQLPAPIRTPSVTLTSVEVQTGEGIAAAIERSCDCNINTFANIGVLIKRGDVQVAHIDGIRALNFFGAADFVVYPGDVVLWGTVDDARSMATDGIPTAKGWYNLQDGKNYFSWGVEPNEQVWSIAPKDTSWTLVK